MTNGIALFLGLAVLTAIVADMVLWQSEHLTFLARRSLALIDWIAVWR
ncbi:hypothetical protein ROJ8625_01221 [Roseivivax jejudonensis]|uniref:Glyceraldehyde-3-phosphate dehydrogenase n=1 Tax=Roseivivax jejudonensis TaxID=1529041 RepID=A0A1X6YQZ9_9RHOB|nr:hypothetical protein [Roseivivax jejudonensis]SLN28725.1 hypothetical protein ROJ8625_01221 [Roseivivax jejudonensis]